MREITSILAIPFFILLITKFKMNKITWLFCTILGIWALLFFTDVSYFTFFYCFIIVGILKTITLICTKKTDISTYNIMNFIYSAGIPITLSIINVFIKTEIFTIPIICIMASIISDTAASEIGQAIKTKTYLITNLKTVKSGTDGGISISGTIGFIVTTFIFLLLCHLTFSISSSKLIFIGIISIFSCIFDSILGATIQKIKMVDNMQTNFIAISFSFIASILHVILK